MLLADRVSAGLKLTKCLQQAFNSKIPESFAPRPKLEGSVYHILRPSNIEHVLRLPGFVSPDILRITPIRTTPTVPEA